MLLQFFQAKARLARARESRNAREARKEGGPSCPRNPEELTQAQRDEMASEALARKLEQEEQDAALAERMERMGW